MKKERKKITTEEQKEIQWFLDFIDIKDFKRLSNKERAEIAGVIEKHIHYQKLGERQEFLPPRRKLMEFLDGLTAPARLASFQKKIKDYFKFMILGINRAINTPTNKWTKHEETDFYPHLGFAQITITFNSSVDGLRFEHKKKDGRYVEHKLKPESIKDAVIDASYSSSIVESFFLYSFISLINGKKITAFKKCPECGKWFVNLTKREKIYCTRHCASKRGTREGRKELERKIDAGDPEAIQKKKIIDAKTRTRSSRAYEKTQPNAKITKRPRKPHWDFEKGAFTE